MKRWLAIACALLVALAARAQAPLDDASTRVDLWPHVRVLGDASGQVTVTQALAMRDRFALPAGAVASLGMAKEVTWLRVPLDVRGGGDGLWILQLDYALLRRVDAWLVTDGVPGAAIALGDALPFATRPLQSRVPATALSLAAGKPQELLLRIDTAGARILPLSLQRLPAFHARAMAEQLIQGAFAALALFLLLYSLTQWLQLRQALYLKYALLVLASALFSIHFFGIGEMYLWTDRAWPQHHLAGVASLLAAAATALFVEDALAADLDRRLRMALEAIAAIQAGAALAHGLDLIDIQTVAIFMSTTGLAPALLGLPGAIRRTRRGDPVGAWFIVAWIGYFVASAVLVGVVRGRIGATWLTLHSFQAGATLDMLVFMRIAVLRTAARHRDAQRAVREHDTLVSLVHSDPLTGLLNRRGLDEALLPALERATPERLLALYVIDLDGFKPVNDQYGHAVGDSLLRIVGQRLRWCTRTGDIVARLGGDEFVVVAERLASERQAAELGRKLLEALASRVAIDSHSCTVSATVGYALAPADAADAHTLLKAADVAMYDGKHAGKGRLVRASQRETVAAE